MTSVGAVTRQIAALEISQKPNTQGSTKPTTLQKKASQNGSNVTKLLSKFAAPNPPPARGKGATNAASSATAASKTRPQSPTKPTTHQQQAQQQKPRVFDIGSYDGGLEIDNENRGEKVTGEAAEELALDSSVAK